MSGLNDLNCREQEFFDIDWKFFGKITVRLRLIYIGNNERSVII